MYNVIWILKIWRSHSGVAEDSGLLECDTVSQGEWFLTFWRIKQSKNLDCLTLEGTTVLWKVINLSFSDTASHARRLDVLNLNILLLGWTNDLRSSPKTGSRSICIVAKRVFPCEHAYYTSDGITDIDAHSHDHQTAKMCAANYFYWDTEDCSITHNHPYICERPLDDIGESLVIIITQPAYLGCQMEAGLLLFHLNSWPSCKCAWTLKLKLT